MTPAIVFLTSLISSEAFSRIIGVKPAFMRPPYGSYNDLVLEVAYTRNQSGALYSVIMRR